MTTRADGVFEVKLRVILAIALYAFLGALNVQGQQPPMAGAYGEASKTDREVIQAANFAVKQARREKHTAISLIAIKSAQQQVVEGINFKLCLKVKIKGKVESVGTVVYRNLKNKFSLSSWVERCEPLGDPMIKSSE